MEEEVEKVRSAINDYLLSIEWHEMDQDARIQSFWEDIGSDIFDDESIEEHYANKSFEKVEGDYERYMMENLKE